MFNECFNQYDELDMVSYCLLSHYFNSNITPVNENKIILIGGKYLHMKMDIHKINSKYRTSRTYEI